jgi:methionyl-tRNA formyltransferase
MTQTIRPGDTAGDLLQRLADGAAGLLVQTLDGIEDGSLEAREQPADGVSFAPKITVDDAKVVWTEPAVAVDRRIRACTPDPGAWTLLAGERVKLGPVRPVAAEQDPPVDLEPGQVHADKKTVLVGTATSPVQLGRVQAHGRKELDAADWARGSRLEPGARFGG